MSNAQLTRTEHLEFDDARIALERALGVPVELVTSAAVTQRYVTASPGAEIASGPPSAALTDAFQGALPFVQETARNCFLVGVPVAGEEAQGLFAIGELEADPHTLAASLARLAFENEQLRSQLCERESRLESYGDQVIQDFEERSWFEELAGLEICDVTHDIAEVAARLLPHLCQILHAETITFVRADRGGGHETPALSTVQDAEGVACDNRGVVHGIVDRYRHAASKQAVVQNDTTEFPGVESFVLATVSRDTFCLGWLLSINRRSPSAALGFGQDSFGTADARLMYAAARVLASHNHTLDLFQANKDLAFGAIQSLAGTVDAKDPYTRGHSDRVAHMARQLGFRLGLDQQQQQQLLMTGLLHDIGKIGVPDNVLQKPGKLTEAEFALIKRHPVLGYQILEPIKSLRYALPGVLEHHEAFDGSGYPGGLKGHEISLYGRIVAIVDAYDAMTSDRTYRNGMPSAKAEGILRSRAGSQWDPEMTQVFLEHVVEDFRHICRTSRDNSQGNRDLGRTLLEDPSAEMAWARAVSKELRLASAAHEDQLPPPGA